MNEKIRAFVMDVDGTLTDGKIYMGSQGEEFKAFNIKDGYGIHEILPRYSIKTAIMTGRTSDIVINRAKELDIDYIFQDVKDKGAMICDFAEELKCELCQIVYMGDDIVDIAAMQMCGIKGCPADAVAEVKEICDYVSLKNGGDGAVRDFIEWLVRKKIEQEKI